MQEQACYRGDSPNLYMVYIWENYEKADEISLVMLFNKLQTKKDVAKLREIPTHKLEGILEGTPDHVVNVIADVLSVFLLRANVPTEEAEELVEKVKEKKMSELFENMEKMDIQAERRKTAKQKARADKAEERADKAEERGIRNLIDMGREFGRSREEMLDRLVAKCELSRQEAEEWLEKLWKE